MKNIGVWRSWLARRVWDAEVEGSSPFTPTIYYQSLFTEVILGISTGTSDLYFL